MTDSIRDQRVKHILWQRDQIEALSRGSMAPGGTVPPGAMLVYTATRDHEPMPKLSFQHVGTNIGTVLRVFVNEKLECLIMVEPFMKRDNEHQAPKKIIDLRMIMMRGFEVRVSSDYPLASGIQIIVGDHDG
jgi:hypothetical protein